MYIVLVAGPGIGKTDALREVTRFWNHLKELHIAPSSVSRASLTDALNAATRRVLRPGEPVPYLEFNSLQVCAEELGTFLTQYETEFMSTLNHLWDCIRYVEKKRSMKDAIIMQDPQLNMIAGTTPAWLGGTLPEAAWAEGFSSRLVMIYSGERVRVDPWAEESIDEALETALIDDLQAIHAMYGQMKFEDAVVDAYRHWVAADCPPIPDHPKLEHYLPRRKTMLMKLAMVMSVQRAGDYVVRIEDYQRAMDFLVEAEVVMPDVFRAMRYNSDSNILDETFTFVWQIFSKNNEPVAEHRILHFLMQRMPSHSVSKALEVMVGSNLLTIADISGPGGRPRYKPNPRTS